MASSLLFAVEGEALTPPPNSAHKVSANVQVVLSFLPLKGRRSDEKTPDTATGRAAFQSTLAKVKATLSGTDDMGNAITIKARPVYKTLVYNPNYDTGGYSSEGVFFRPEIYMGKVRGLDKLSSSIRTKSGTYNVKVSAETISKPVPPPMKKQTSLVTINHQFIPMKTPKLSDGMYVQPAPKVDQLLGEVSAAVKTGLAGRDSAGQELAVQSGYSTTNPPNVKFAPSGNAIVYYTEGKFTDRDATAYSAKVSRLRAKSLSQPAVNRFGQFGQLTVTVKPEFFFGGGEVGIPTDPKFPGAQ